MKQKTTQCFVSPCGKVHIFIDNDMPIGVFHDFLMEMKGNMVDRMVEAHKQQQKEAEDQAALSNCEVL